MQKSVLIDEQTLQITVKKAKWRLYEDIIDFKEQLATVNINRAKISIIKDVF
jgi:hypothetical protein